MTRCHHLDAYLDGRLSDADALDFEAHALVCPQCDAALAEPLGDLRALADTACPPALLAEVLDAPDAPPLFADGYRQLASVTCPPEVVAAALRTARRAPDRAARRRPSRRPVRRAAVWAVGLAAALAVVVGVWTERAPEPVTVAVVPAPDVSSSRPDGTVPPAVSALQPPAELAEPAVQPGSEPSVSRTRPPAPAVRPTPPVEAPPSSETAPPATAASAPPAGDLAQASGPAEPEITDADIENAQRDLALAFRLVAQAQTRAREAVRDEAGALSATIDQTLPF